MGDELGDEGRCWDVLGFSPHFLGKFLMLFCIYYLFLQRETVCKATTDSVTDIFTDYCNGYCNDYCNDKKKR